MQLVVNIVAVLTACGGSLALGASPLSAVQMLWVNLIMDSLASLSLATDSPTDDMLDLPPYSVQQSLITPTVRSIPWVFAVRVTQHPAASCVLHAPLEGWLLRCRAV